MNKRMAKRLVHINRFAPWIFYYLVCTYNSFFHFYTCIISFFPFGVTNTPQNILSFILVYLLLSIYFLGPNSLISREDLHRVEIMRRIFFITFLMSCALLFFLFMWSLEKDNFIMGIIIIIMLQSLIFRECVLIIFLEMSVQGPLEIYLYITSNLSEISNVNIMPYIMNFGLLRILYFLCIYGLVIFVCGISTIIDSHPLTFILQFMYILWTQQIILMFYASYTCVSFMLRITSPTILGTWKRMYIIGGKCLSNIGMIIYLSMLNMFFQFIHLFKIIIFFNRWPQSIKQKISYMLKRHFTILYFYYMYRIKTVVVASILFDMSPRDAITKLLQITNNQQQAFANALQCGQTERITNIFSTYFIIFVLSPVLMLQLIMETLTNEGGYIKILSILIWSTYTSSTIGYIKTEIIHISILLAHSQKISLGHYWTEEYLTNLHIA